MWIIDSNKKNKGGLRLDFFHVFFVCLWSSFSFNNNNKKNGFDLIWSPPLSLVNFLFSVQSDDFFVIINHWNMIIVWWWWWWYSWSWYEWYNWLFSQKKNKWIMILNYLFFNLDFVLSIWSSFSAFICDECLMYNDEESFPRMSL